MKAIKAANAGQAFARASVDEWIRCGLTHVCLSPGSRSTPLALAFAERPEIQLHVLIDERSSSFLALGIAKRIRRPVAVVTTSGTAAANLYPAVVEAKQSTTPLLVITADRPPELRDTGANQAIDQIKLYGGYPKWFHEVGVPEAAPGMPEYWRSTACRAYHSSEIFPPGPVHLNVALREPFIPGPEDPEFPYPLDGRPGGRPWSIVTGRRSLPPDDEVLRLAEEIAGSEKGLIVAGACEVDPQPIVDLAAAAGWPLLAEPHSNARYGPTAVSAYEALLRNETFLTQHRPEVVLRIGSSGTSPALVSLLDPSIRQVHIGASDSWPDPRRGISYFVKADPEEVCRALVEQVGSRPRSAWLEAWLRAEANARAAIDAALDEMEAVSEPAIARDLAAVLPNGATLVVGSSMPIRDLDWFMRPREGLRILANRGASGIDGFVSTTLGAALAVPGPTVGFCGDLSMLHDQNGLMLAAQGNVSAVFVVINNNGGGIFSFLPQADHSGPFELLFGTPHNLDFAAIAATYRVAYQRLRKPSELGPVLAAALAKGGVHLIEARTDRSDNVRLHRRLLTLDLKKA